MVDHITSEKEELKVQITVEYFWQTLTYSEMSQW